MKKTILLTIVLIALNLIATINTFSQIVAENPAKQYKNTNVLLITDDNYGSSFVYGEKNNKSIKKQFEDFGWNMTIASIKDTVMPCDWGKKTLNTKPMSLTSNIVEIKNPSEFDAIIILPGRGYPNLINNIEVLNFLKKANQEEIIIAAWCRGVRLLAAADIIKGKNVIGHFDYFDEYKAAGANYIEYSFKFENGEKLFKNVTPPIKDGNIITTVRSLYYRNEMSKLIKEAIEEKSTQEKID